MNSDRNDCQRISRRVALIGTALPCSLIHSSSVIGLSEITYLPVTCSSCQASRQCAGSRFFSQKNKRMKEKAAHACHALCRVRVVEDAETQGNADRRPPEAGAERYRRPAFSVEARSAGGALSLPERRFPLNIGLNRHKRRLIRA
jgi:hypothetical protein